jgi:hypothetical protein
LTGILKDRRGIFRFSSREVGYAAAFGGLAFAFRALGIIIPIGGPLTADPRDLMQLIGPAFGGPIAGIAIGLLGALPSGLPMLDIPISPVICFLVGLSFRALKRPWYYLALPFILALWTFLTGLDLDVLGIMPFWPAVATVVPVMLVYFPIVVFFIEMLRRYSGNMRRAIDG